jgi:hypothetical protein
VISTGWDKILFEVPNDWQLALSQKEIEKGKAKGIFTFKNIDQQLRMSVKWEGIVKKVPKPHVVLDNYLKNLSKKYSKTPVIIRSRKRIKVGGHDAEYALWESKKRQELAVVVSWLCPERERIFLSFWPIQIDEKNELKPQIHQVIESICCHDDWVIWGGPGIALKVPDNLDLVKSSFVIGTSFMNFASGPNIFFIERFGLANQILKKYESLMEFYKEEYIPKMAKRIKGFNFKEPKLYYSHRRTIKEVWGRKFTLKHGKLISKQKVLIHQYFWINTNQNAMFFITVALGSPKTKINDLFPRRIFATILRQLLRAK